MASKLFDSRLASLHHYHIVFFEANEIASIKDLYKLFLATKNQESIKLAYPGVSFIHFQLELPGAYGSPMILAGNKTRDIEDIPYYWYDFYLGEMLIGKEQFFFISFPYVKLGKYVEKVLSTNTVRRTLYKPAMENVMEFMKTHNGGYVFKKEKLVVDISRYTAKVLEDAADKINISGGNPLNSEVYTILSNAKKIRIETTSLRMSCFIPDVGQIDLAFDKLGNYRFWIPYNKEVSTFSAFPAVFKFFKEKGLTVEDTFFNSFSMLEDDKG